MNYTQQPPMSYVYFCLDVKGIADPKMKILSLITHPRIKARPKTFGHFQNLNEDLFNEI